MILLASALVLITSVVAEERKGNSNCTENYIQGEPIQGNCLPTYNAPAAIIVSQKTRVPLTAFVDASLLYWYGAEEGLGIATNSILNLGTAYLPTTIHSLRMGFDYKPGFKVRLGVVAEQEWSVYAEYTWLRGRNTVQQTPPAIVTTSGVPATTAATGTPVWSIDDWFLQGTAGGQTLSASSISAVWRYGIDVLDVMASRPYYLGDRLAISPYAGLRAIWIRQMMKVSLTEAPGLFGTSTGIVSTAVPGQPIVSQNISQCWGIGPRVGFDGACLLVRGFRILGNLAASLVYTSYTKLDHREDSASPSFNSGGLSVSPGHTDSFLRPIAELGLGFGWGSYFQNQTYHLDVAATYDFTLLWDQNEMRKLLDYVLTAANPAATDLYFQGLTISSRFDF